MTETGNVAMAAKHLPSVAVVIPCWNSEKWIARAIQSIMDQNYPNWDIMVIDDGSTDGSLEIIRSFGDKIRWETGPNRGACAARNRGAELSLSQYLLFLDADDYLEGPLIYSQALASLAADSDLCFGPSALEFPDKSRQPRPKPDVGRSLEDLLARFLGDGWVPPHSILWNRTFFNEIGGWNIKLRQNQDGELLSRAILHGPKLASSCSGLAVYVQHNSRLRISAQRSHEALESHLDYLTELALKIDETEFAAVRTSIARRAYELASASFYHDQVVTGRRALVLARACGFGGHIGSFLHRMFCRIAGLDVKQRLSRRFHQIRNRN